MKLLAGDDSPETTETEFQVR